MAKNRLLIGFAVIGMGMAAAACSRDDPAADNTTVIETVDPMTNMTNDSLGNQIDTLNNATQSETGSVVNTTGDMATDATTTVGSTSSSGPSTTRETRGERQPQ